VNEIVVSTPPTSGILPDILSDTPAAVAELSVSVNVVEEVVPLCTLIVTTPGALLDLSMRLTFWTLQLSFFAGSKTVFQPSAQNQLSLSSGWLSLLNKTSV